MKKSFSILLIAVFYLFISSGVCFSLHYCGGKLKSFSFISYHAEDGCCCGAKKKRKGCCKEKTVFITVKDIHKSVDVLKAPSSTENHLLYTGTYVLKLNYSIAVLNSPTLSYHKPPPLISSTPLYLSYRVLLV